MSIIIKGITKAQFYKDLNKLPYMDVGWDIEELPPHGRLIDADELNRKMYHDAFETDSDMQKWDSGCWVRYKMFENNLRDAPTIIEAEEEE